MATKPKKKKSTKRTPARSKAEHAKAPRSGKPAIPARPGGTNPQRVAAILAKLDEAYPHATCELNHKNAFELLIATILSAQCTDVRVNQVTQTLFNKYPDAKAFAYATPSEMEQILTLPGVARKTANVVLGTAYRIPSGIVVDTHVQRIANRLDLTRNEDPKKIEQDLMQVIPKDKWILFSHQIIWHGRRICQARKPKCAECNLESLCYAKDKTI